MTVYPLLRVEDIHPKIVAVVRHEFKLIHPLFDMIWENMKADEEAEKLDTARLIITAARDRPPIEDIAYPPTPEALEKKVHGSLLGVTIYYEDTARFYDECDIKSFGKVRIGAEDGTSARRYERKIRQTRTSPYPIICAKLKL